MRINKYLAECGVASRRKAEDFITSGKVRVNNKVLKDLFYDVNVDNDTILVDGIKVEQIKKHIYIMLNKPKGYICSTNDEKGRKTVLELIKDKYAYKRIFPVGRLDFDTEGLLILTTDGDMANRLMHPSFEISKTYIAKIEGEIAESELVKLRNGIILDGRVTKRCRVKLLSFENNISRIEIGISEGRNRQVRRMFESINRDVIFLKRTQIGELKLGGLSRGEYRELREKEAEFLRKL